MTDFLEPYNFKWKSEFEDFKRVLTSELKNSQVDIQHVGSTAIPGLLAKPILDIDVIIKDESLLGEVIVELQRLGYNNRGEQGIRGRFALRQTSSFTPQTASLRVWQTHHL